MTPPATNSLDPANAPDAAVLVALTRMEAKVDIALAQHGAEIKAQGETVTDHEARLRTLDTASSETKSVVKSQGEALTDHETRLRAQESKPTVSPRALWTTVTSAAGFAVALVTVLDRLTS